MGDQTPKQLDRHWLDVPSWLVSRWPLALTLLFIFLGCLLAFHTAVRKERLIAGVVKQASWRLNQDTGERYLDIHVALPRERVVRAVSFASLPPEIGAHVTLRKRAMLLGYTTYMWDGPSTPPPPLVPTAAPTPVSLP